MIDVVWLAKTLYKKTKTTLNNANMYYTFSKLMSQVKTFNYLLFKSRQLFRYKECIQT